MPPEAKVSIDKAFEEDILERFKEILAEAGAARMKGESYRWLLPKIDKWSGDLLKVDEFKDAFDREELNNKFVEAISDPDSPGTSGDLVLATLQIDTLACMQRSFTVRHALRRPRATMQMAARESGHGSDKGVLINVVLEYLRSVEAGSKGN